VESGAQPGNKNATKEHRLITSALRRAVVQSPDKLRAACEKVLQDAADGNLPAFNAIADRLDGKPAQSVSIGNEEGETFKTESTVSLRPQETREEYLKRMEL